MQLWLDCDGVLADFDKKAIEVLGETPQDYEERTGKNDFWARLYETPDFFTNLEPMPDAQELVESVRHLNPKILTGLPNGGWAQAQKLEWKKKQPWLKGIQMNFSKSRYKCMYCMPGDILIDDWHKYMHFWQRAGGIFLYHVSAKASIEKLKDLEIL